MLVHGASLLVWRAHLSISLSMAPWLLYLLEDEGTLVAGFSAIISGEFTPDFVSDEELGEYQEDYELDKLAALLGDNYKVFIIKKSVLDSVAPLFAEFTL